MDYTYNDFTGQDLSGQDFSYRDMTGSNFAGTKLSGTKFNNAILQYANFRGANVDGAIFDGAYLGYASFKDVDNSKATFVGSKTRMSPIMHETLTGADTVIEPVDSDKIEADKEKLSGLTVVLDSFDDRKVSNHQMMAHGRKTGKYIEALEMHGDAAVVDRLFAEDKFKFYIADRSSGKTTEVTYYPPENNPLADGSSDEPQGSFDTAPYTELFVI